MLIITRFQPRIYRTVNSIKMFWYNLLFFFVFVPIVFFLEAYFVIDKVSTEFKETVPFYVNLFFKKKVDDRYQL